MNCEPKTIAPVLAGFEKVVSQNDERYPVYCDWTKTIVYVLGGQCYESTLLLIMYGNAFAADQVSNRNMRAQRGLCNMVE